MSAKLDSLRDAGRLMERLNSDKDLLGRVQAARSYDEFLRTTRDEGYDLSGLTEQEARGLATGDPTALKEISEEDLARVAGGLASGAYNTTTVSPSGYQPDPYHLGSNQW
ncbi:MAG TPA: Nif11-like leader peptide family RiPP precursor [Thermoanaerobaculia bacterium]|nr:Nif11-like leader peptide family RiPP precursor [Thermoanaerobaculia bacterium]